MIIIAGRLQVDPDGRDRYVADCVLVVEQARAATGCLDFAITADTVDAGRVNVYERWDTDADVEAFRGPGPDDAQTAQILDAEVQKYRISATEAA